MSRRNIGVAIGVPEPFGAELQDWRERLGDPNAAAIVPHITLLPPTLVPRERLPVIEEHLRRVAAGATAFEIHLRGAGTFRPVSPVVFVPLVMGIAECEQLEEQIRSGPLSREVRFPYHPHVTVAHDIPADGLDHAYRALQTFDAQFTVTGFSLFEQDAQRRWAPQREFGFDGRLAQPATRPRGDGW